MRLGAPVIAVIGHMNSGKTTVIEKLVRELREGGYRVATAKHIQKKGFSMDTEGKDTWRHATAGANPVISISDTETAIIIKNGENDFSLEQILRFLLEIDVVLLEGFSQMVLNDERVGKIVCVKNRQEYEEYREKLRDEAIAFCSRQTLKPPILNIKEDFPLLARRTLKFVQKERKISKILNRLPTLDCKKCGYASCEQFAVAVYEGKAKLSDCLPLKLKTKLKTKLIVNDAEMPIQPFVSKIIRNSVLGMVSSLKGVSIEGDETIQIKISPKTRRN